MMMQEQSNINARKKLDLLIGREEIKEKLDTLLSAAEYNRKNLNKIIEMPQKIHWILEGNPGTGKALIAELIGQVYKECGILSDGRIHLVNRFDLVADYIGQTSLKTQQCIEQAKGGVLFIDEPYSIIRSKSAKDFFGIEAMDMIFKQILNGTNEVVVIFAGYSDKMENFLEKSPDLVSCMQKIVLEDYTAEELTKIFVLKCKDENILVDDILLSNMENFFENKMLTESKYDHWSNGREVEKLLQQMLYEWANKPIYGAGRQDIQRQVLTLEHIPTDQKKYLAVLNQHDVILEEKSGILANAIDTGITDFSSDETEKIQEIFRLYSSKTFIKADEREKYIALSNKDVNLLVQWFEKKRDIKMLTELGDIFFRGGNCDCDYEKAYYLWNRAIDLATQTDSDSTNAEKGLFYFFSPQCIGSKDRKNLFVAKLIGLSLVKKGKVEILEELLRFADEYDISKKYGEKLLEQIERNTEDSIDKFLKLIDIYAHGVTVLRTGTEMIRIDKKMAEKWYLYLKKHDIELIEQCEENRVEEICKLIEFYWMGVTDIIDPDNKKGRYWYSELEKLDREEWEDRLDPFVVYDYSKVNEE